jgi:hypothetical protein
MPVGRNQNLPFSANLHGLHRKLAAQLRCGKDIFLLAGVAGLNENPMQAQSAASYGTAVSYTGPIQVLSINPIPVFAQVGRKSSLRTCRSQPRCQVNGVFNMVFAYGGAMIFPEMMAEMRRPRDFIKGMAIAQLLIFCCYLMYGIFVYCFQGQCMCFFCLRVVVP